MNNLVEKARAIENLPEEHFFKNAFDYYEVRVPKKKLVQLFLDYLHRDQIPQCVEDFAIEVLSGRLTHEDET